MEKRISAGGGRSLIGLRTPVGPVTVRQLEADAAVCLDHFSRHFGLQHPELTRFIDHLHSLAGAQNIIEWEGTLTTLKVNGLGDPLPQSLEKLVPPALVPDFLSLLENAVEVGLGDMYGAYTTRPMSHLQTCVAILEKNSVPVPLLLTDISVLLVHGGWGKPVHHASISS